MTASRTFVTISVLPSRDAIMIMLSSWLCVDQPSIADHLWQSGRQDIYECEVPRNLPETAPDQCGHLSTMRVRRKGGEA
jgi:hypothetical protein